LSSINELHTVSLHDALPICLGIGSADADKVVPKLVAKRFDSLPFLRWQFAWLEGRLLSALLVLLTEIDPVLAHLLSVLVGAFDRSEEHTSELQSRENLVCRL